MPLIAAAPLFLKVPLQAKLQNHNGSTTTNAWTVTALIGTVRVFGQTVTLEDAIGSHACSLEASMRVIDGIPLARVSPPYQLARQIRFQTLKEQKYKNSLDECPTPLDP